MVKFIQRNWEYIIFGFFMFSISLWFVEILYSLIFRFKLVLPGTLSGPWCPIYGTAFIFLLLFINKKDNQFYNFIKIFVIAVVIEYITSYISDEIFNNVIWDYTDKFLNINGRVCLEMSFIFAVVGYLIMYYIEPSLRRLYIRLSSKVKIINVVLGTIFY